MNKKRILISVSRLGIGGIQRFILQLAEYLTTNHKDLSISIYVHYPDFHIHLPNSVKIKGVNIYTFTNNFTVLRIVNVLTRLGQYFSKRINLKELIINYYYMQLVRIKKFDLIHSNIALTDALAIKSKIKYNIPFVLTNHGSYVDGDYSKKQNSHIYKVLHHCSAIVYLADKSFTFFNNYNINRNKLYFIPNGFIDTQHRILYKSNPILKFCMVARGDILKGWNQLNEAIELLKEEELSFEIHIVGDGEFVKQLFAEREFESIYFYGSVENPIEIISKSDVGILPSQLELMPYSIIEYLFSAKPVIASNAGAIPWMLSIGNNSEMAGDIIHLNNEGIVEPRELANTMKKYILDRKMLERKKNLAFEAFNKFHIRESANRYYQLYKSILVK